MSSPIVSIITFRWPLEWSKHAEHWQLSRKNMNGKSKVVPSDQLVDANEYPWASFTATESIMRFSVFPKSARGLLAVSFVEISSQFLLFASAQALTSPPTTFIFVGISIARVCCGSVDVCGSEILLWGSWGVNYYY
eukprot:1308024-Rhodomonas_salina.2